MAIYPPILFGRTIIAPKMPPSDKKRILIEKKYSTFVLEIEWQAERVQKKDFIFDGKQ